MVNSEQELMSREFPNIFELLYSTRERRNNHLKSGDIHQFNNQHNEQCPYKNFAIAWEHKISKLHAQVRLVITMFFTLRFFNKIVNKVFKVIMQMPFL